MNEKQVEFGVYIALIKIARKIATPIIFWI